MATGIIGALNGAGTITYSPTSAAKVNITYNGQTGCTINGAKVLPAATNACNTATVWVGAGQTLTVAPIDSTTANVGSVIVSSVES